MWIPDALYERANHAKGRIKFFCAYGHSQVFCVGENDETKLRRERDLLKQQLAEKDDTIKYWRDGKEQAEKRLSATKGVVTRIKNRVGHGVCPCCTRTFSNLARHMETKHAGFAAETAE
jgi:hypothetical protein